jgi:hypothetical protein
LKTTVGANKVAKNENAQIALFSYFSRTTSSTKTASKKSNEMEISLMAYSLGSGR